MKRLLPLLLLALIPAPSAARLLTAVRRSTCGTTSLGGTGVAHARRDDRPGSRARCRRIDLADR